MSAPLRVDRRPDHLHRGATGLRAGHARRHLVPLRSEGCRPDCAAAGGRRGPGRRAARAVILLPCHWRTPGVVAGPLGEPLVSITDAGVIMVSKTLPPRWHQLPEDVGAAGYLLCLSWSGWKKPTFYENL